MQPLLAVVVRETEAPPLIAEVVLMLLLLDIVRKPLNAPPEERLNGPEFVMVVVLAPVNVIEGVTVLSGPIAAPTVLKDIEVVPVKLPVGWEMMPPFVLKEIAVPLTAPTKII